MQTTSRLYKKLAASAQQRHLFDEPCTQAPRRAERPQPANQRPQYRDALYWQSEMLKATDPQRKKECKDNMILCLKALDETS